MKLLLDDLSLLFDSVKSCIEIGELGVDLQSEVFHCILYVLICLRDAVIGLSLGYGAGRHLADFGGIVTTWKTNKVWANKEEEVRSRIPSREIFKGLRVRA
jgi:hypothetical protein